jgi:hypothetical protein
MVCMLNRKPYRDKDGLLRVRSQSMCCKNKSHGCTLTKQPDGNVIRHTPAKALPKVSKHEKKELSI